MASITNPRGENSSRASLPSVGIVTFNAKEGKFSTYFQAVKNEKGEVVKEAFNAPIRNPKFMVVSVGFFRIVGGKPDRKDRTRFIGVSSPVVCSDKGFKWSQYIPVWVGRDSQTPDFYGTWSEIKEKVEGKGGRYAELLFVLAADYPDRLLLLELTGYSISQLKDAVKLATNSNYTSALVEGIHTLEMVATDEYDIDGRIFKKPVFQVLPFNEKSNGYQKIYPILVELSQQTDAYGDELAAKQKSGDLQPTRDGQEGQERTALPHPDSRFPSSERPTGGSTTTAEREYPARPEDDEPEPQNQNFDDLPF